METSHSPRRFGARVLFVALAALLGLWAAGRFLPAVNPLLYALLATGLVAVLVWALTLGLRAFLWRVGRRLAFSYLLIGVLPIPMLLVLLTVALTLLGGFFLGHLFRTHADDLQRELDKAAISALELWSGGRQPPAASDRYRFAYYRLGRRSAGDSSLPERWPGWLDEPYPSSRDSSTLRLVALEGESPNLAAAASRGDFGVVAVYGPELSLLLSERCNAWVQLLRGNDPERGETVTVNLFGRKLTIRLPTTQEPLGAADPQERDRFLARLEQGGRWLDRTRLDWVELPGPLRALDSGEVWVDGGIQVDKVSALLITSQSSLVQQLFSTSNEIKLFAWGMLFLVGSLLASLYFIAAIVAIFMIYTLSRAVNQLSRATDAVRRGDFSFRLQVRRQDQVGQLQRSFNEMAGDLENLVEQTARQEILEKELELARDVQRSLIPENLPTTRGIEFVSLFQPSAAIGGDYFDVLRLGEHRLAVTIADVSGHGLSAGLRMAMLKAALQILFSESPDARQIFSRLNTMLRSGAQGRFFVTATICLLDYRTGVLELTNAGHPPTYLLRGGTVEEILLPSSPLGGLGDNYARREIQLEAGDTIVCLSDGLIEATDDEGEPFGYQRILETLEEASGTPSDVRRCLLKAIKRYTGGRPAEDDQTLVVMRYGAPAESIARGAEARASRTGSPSSESPSVE